MCAARWFPQRLLPLLLALGIGLLSSPSVGAENDEADLSALQARLSKARYLEITGGSHAEALERYEALLQEEDLDAQVRGNALLGRARCLMALDRQEEAVAIWEAIRDDKTLQAKVLDAARTALDAYLAERGKRDEAEKTAEAIEHLRELRRQDAEELLERASRALEEGQIETARGLCLSAKRLLPDDPAADRLLERILQATPDQGEILRQLLRFADTTYRRELRLLKDEVVRLRREGRERFDDEDLAGAATKFRTAISRIDESDYLPDLADERDRTVIWLRKTLIDGKARGLDLGEEPAVPDPFQRPPDWRRDLHGLLGRMFSHREGEEDPLIVYEIRPALVPPDATPASIAPGPFPPGMTVTRGPGTLSRAWWMEQWIRAHVGTGWGKDEGPSGRPRVLDRFGDVLIVQNNRSAHERVREALGEFSPLTTPVIVDIAVVASTTAGGVQLSTQLGLEALPRASGLELVATNRLFEESLRAAKAFEGLELLGTARLTLKGEPTATVAVTRRSEHHPIYDGLPNPKLELKADESKYGLFLDLFAEDLTNAEGTGRAALGVLATTRVPQGTVVVHRPASRLRYERVAQPMAEQAIEAFEVVPHGGTLVVQGLTNPFPGAKDRWPGLTILLAVRPADDGTGRPPMPDPDREPVVPPGGRRNGLEEREIALGPLGEEDEVQDAVLVEGWPRRPLLDPISKSTARKARERYLESQLGGPWSGIAAPGEASPVTVTGAFATAALTAGDHAKLARAVEHLRSAETALYEVDVLTAEVAEETLAEWMRQGDVVAFTPGTYLATSPEGERAIDQRMRTEGSSGGLYALQSRILSRATQKVAAHNLRTVRIVSDLHFWRNPDGVLRYIPVPGLAEEGIVVMVRPEFDSGATRLVTVEAQAARLRTLERVSLPEVELPDALITVARYHPVQSRRAAAPLGNAEAMLLTLPAPEGTGRVILVKVRVRRLQ